MKLNPGQSIQSIMNNYPDETLFELEPGVYSGPVTFNPSIHNKILKSIDLNHLPDATKIVSNGTYSIGSLPGSYDIKLEGISAKNENPDGTIVDITGDKIKIGNCLFQGDPKKGQHRGIAVNGEEINIVKTRVEDCFLASRDAQAICGWKRTKNLTIDSCYLEGGAQSVMFGGSDCLQAEIPINIRMTNSILTKKRDWYFPELFNPTPQLKCSLELKNCINFYSSNCIFEYSGIAQGQGSYLIVLTPRNQGGKAPFSTVQNVLIENCMGYHAGGCISFMGSDNIHPSGPLSNITIRNVSFNDIDHKIWKGSGRIFQFERTPSNLQLENIKIFGGLSNVNKLNANVYFIGKPPINISMKGIEWPTTVYDLKIDGGGMGLVALRNYCPSLSYENVTYSN